MGGLLVAIRDRLAYRELLPLYPRQATFRTRCRLSRRLGPLDLQHRTNRRGGRVPVMFDLLIRMQLLRVVSRDIRAVQICGETRDDQAIPSILPDTWRFFAKYGLASRKFGLTEPSGQLL